LGSPQSGEPISFSAVRFPFLILLLAATSAWAAPREIVVCQYNVENYLDAKAAGEGSKFGTRAKSEEAAEALVHIIHEISPDILGVCEMGSPERFEDFKKRLAMAGLGYTDFEYVQAADPDRHLALLSRFPIVARQSAKDVVFEIDGRREKVRRGFLDVTIQVNADYQLRMVGVHLKSKLAAPTGEAVIRRLEATKLRAHLDGILRADPEVNLVCYGDFNDTKNEAMFAEVSGVKGTPGYLADLWASDTSGERWTHYWKTADLYSRIDYLFVSPALFNEVVKAKSRIYRGEDWNEASDHPPVFTSIAPVNRPHKAFTESAKENR
jgi:endonuclease/exonuclease/phosphatase family metal-dependent hydrolase